MSKYLKIAFIAIIIAIIYREVYAQELILGKKIMVETIFCDTKEQVVDIMETHQKEGYEAAVAVFRRYNTEINEKQEVACGSAALPVIPVDQIGKWEGLKHPMGTFTYYVIKVLTPMGTFYMISELPLTLGSSA